MRRLVLTGLFLTGCLTPKSPTDDTGNGLPPNDTPTISWQIPTLGASWDEGDLVTFTVTAADLEDGLEGLEVSISSDLDGELGTAVSDAAGMATLESSALSFGSHALTAQVTDSRGDTGETERQFLVNGVPTAITIHLEPAQPTTVDDLQVVFDTESMDPDGGDIYYRYAWSLDGVGTGTNDGDFISASGTLRGQEWQVEVTPFELAADGPSVTASVIIVNSLPVIDDVAVSPVTAFTNDDLICLGGTTSDLDGDPVTVSYAWTTAGFSLSTDATLVSSLTAKNTPYVCTVTPNDGLEDGASLDSSSLTVRNTLPDAPTLDLSTLDPEPGGDDLVCLIDTAASDIDGDALTYTFTWYHDGPVWSGLTSQTTWPGDTIDSQYLVEDETWLCEVETSDGVGASVYASSATATVRNPLPDLDVDGASFTLTDGSYAYDDVNVINGGVLTITGDVEIDAHTFTVDSSSLVTGVGGGPVGVSGANGTGTAPGSWSTNSGGGGGGYGGDGGQGGADANDTPGNGGSAYGTSDSYVIQEGSAGGSSGTTSSYEPGGDAGAALAVYAETIDVAGDIDMSGDNGPFISSAGRGAGGGSGGGLLLHGDVLTITGSLSAAGGNGGSDTSSSSDGGGGGGGGRIKVFYESSLTGSCSATTCWDVSGGVGGCCGGTSSSPDYGEDGGNGSTWSDFRSYP